MARVLVAGNRQPNRFQQLVDAISGTARGGTGKQANWHLAAELATRRTTILAGGLNPANVAEAIDTVHPFAVDVSSGVEASKGIKDPELVRQFIAAAKTDKD